MAYQIVDGKVAITVNDWIRAGLTEAQFKNDSKRGYLEIISRSWYGNTLIDVNSIKRPERKSVIEAFYGKPDESKIISNSLFEVTLDTEARTYFTTKYRKPDGTTLEPEKVTEYVNKASLLNAIKKGLESQTEVRARNNRRINMGEFWTHAKDWMLEMASGKEYACTAYKNKRSLERLFKHYLNGGYMAIIDNRTGNDNARVVSVSMAKLFLALWRTNDKPFIRRVHELYLEWVAGDKELFDKKTGEIFRPEDFRHKGRALEVSEATIWNYLKDVVNNTSVYADRNGNFDYVNTHRPKQHRKLGNFSLSKISMDDVALSRKSVRGWVMKYIAVDVVSGYYFRPAYIVGKPNLDTVHEAFRNMFCELTQLNLPMPGELEVENHLMKDIDWLNDMFPFVRFCQSPTEKRAEHKIKSLKYGTAKKEGHTRGRWYAKHEAWRSVRNKVSGDFIEPTYQPQTIVADDLADIEKHNNELHPLQKRYPGMTRKDVLLTQVNKKLQPIEHWALYQHIGNETETSIRNNDFVMCANEAFELVDFNALKRLKPNNRNVVAYWLPEESGNIANVYIYQGDTYIGEAINRSEFSYNENAIERTEEDQAGMLHQNKRLSTFDKFIKENRVDIPQIGCMDSELSQELADIPTPEKQAEYTDTPLYEDVDHEDIDWSKMAVENL
jgi:hypothetical protein